MKSKPRLVAAMTALALIGEGVGAQTTPAPDTAAQSVSGKGSVGKKGPSLYLRCDGNPNNMSAGESVARFIGAITLLALFAPPAEEPNPSARMFGKDGVAACSQLIEGERREGAVIRRVPLILARALHQIEAGDYQAAIADVDLARGEAKAANLLDDPYFDRSMGVSFDLIEAEARYAANDIAGARRVALGRGSRQHYSYYVLIGVNGYADALRPVDGQELTICKHLAAISRARLGVCFILLEEQRRFADAAAYLRDYNRIFEQDFPNKSQEAALNPRLAIAEALAGDWEAAAGHAAQARAAIKKSLDDGKPVAGQLNLIEMLDFHDLLQLAHQGHMAEARRAFTGRSDWLTVSFGEKAAAIEMLRNGAPSAELTGLLASDPDTLWKERRDRSRAARLEKYKDNHFLWSRILPYASATSYEALSRKAWDAQKAPFFGNRGIEGSGPYSMAVNGDALTQPDAMLLQAALAAEARGHRRFRISMSGNAPGYGVVTFVDSAAPPSAFDLDADEVIAELRGIIPQPAEVERRKAIRAKAGGKAGA